MISRCFEESFSCEKKFALKITLQQRNVKTLPQKKEQKFLQSDKYKYFKYE